VVLWEWGVGVQEMGEIKSCFFKSQTNERMMKEGRKGPNERANRKPKAKGTR
jgi:hypothetical protein